MNDLKPAPRFRRIAWRVGDYVAFHTLPLSYPFLVLRTRRSYVKIDAHHAQRVDDQQVFAIDTRTLVCCEEGFTEYREVRDDADSA